MTKPPIRIALVQFDGHLKSAVLGLQDMFAMANYLAHKDLFYSESLPYQKLRASTSNKDKIPYDVIIIPPSFMSEFYLNPPRQLLVWISQAYHQGILLCTVCSGVFILAQAGLLEGKTVTTHWGLAPELQKRFPSLKLNSNKLIIDEGDIITAGGQMSWMDLGLSLIGRFAGTALLNKVGKYLILDTGRRNQQYYRMMDLSLNHGDDAILKIQRFLIKNYNKKISNKQMAQHVHLGERTLLRHFYKMTGRTPHDYIQELRMQKACEYLEGTTRTIDWIAHFVGYEDLGAFRKTFIKIIGLKPLEFRKKFNF